MFAAAELSILFHTFCFLIYIYISLFKLCLAPTANKFLGLNANLVHIVTYSCFSARGAGFTCQTKNTKAHSSTNGQILHNRTPYLTTQGKLVVLISAKNTYLKIKGGESTLSVLSRTSESPFQPQL